MSQSIVQSPQDAQKSAMRQAELKVYSQFNEDGILQWLFDRLGPGPGRFIEFGIGNGKECNSANLSLHHNWAGLLMDGNAADVHKAQVFYAAQLKLATDRVQVRHAFITAENINDLLHTYAAGRSIDLLSIDIDGSDLWVWQAVTGIRPRVVVIEYNAVFGPHRTLSVIYDPQFERFNYSPTGLYHGASLAALTKIARQKGYILVGCESHGVNAFFVESNEAVRAGLVQLSAEQAWYEHAWRANRFGPDSSEEQFKQIQELRFLEI